MLEHGEKLSGFGGDGDEEKMGALGAPWRCGGAAGGIAPCARAVELGKTGHRQAHAAQTDEHPLRCGRRARGQPLRQRTPRLRDAGQDPPPCAAGVPRRRGPALLRTPRRRHRAPVRRALARHTHHESGAGRIDHYPAAHQAHPFERREDALAQGAGGGAGFAARTADGQGRHTRTLPQRGLLWSRRLRHRGRRQQLFRQKRRGTDAGGGRAAGGRHQVAEQLRAPSGTGKRRGAARPHPANDGGLRLYYAGRGRRGAKRGTRAASFRGERALRMVSGRGGHRGAGETGHQPRRIAHRRLRHLHGAGYRGADGGGGTV